MTTSMAPSTVMLSTSSVRALKPAAQRLCARPVVRSLRVRAAGGDDINEYTSITTKGTTKNPDSYQRIEEPVRGKQIPDGGPPVRERQNDVDRLLVDQDAPQEQNFLRTAVAFPDAMRFKGAAPEIINSRLAMLGFVAAVGAEVVTGRNVFEQVSYAPLTIAATFLLFIIASLIPILKGVPRKGFSIWQPDAEVINGRLAMLGFASIVIFDAWRASN